MTESDKLKMCRGCRDDFYNGHNELGVKRCWALKDAKVVKRWRIGTWTSPSQPGAFLEVETLSCHYAPGKYSHVDNLPVCAVDPIRLTRGRK